MGCHVLSSVVSLTPLQDSVSVLAQAVQVMTTEWIGSRGGVEGGISGGSRCRAMQNSMNLVL